jgi:peptide/nickel transport system permease protein
MRRYIVRRLILMIPTLLGVAVLVFLLMRVIPGDIVEMRYAEGQFFNPELVAKERARFGLDRPLAQQFLDWIWGIVRLDFGLSMWSGNSISHEIAIRLQL